MKKKKDFKQEYIKQSNNSFFRIAKYLLTFLLALILLANLTSNISNKLSEDKNVYNKCTDSCNKKHFLGENIGKDNPWKCTIREYDRTECIQNCNQMYIRIKGFN